MRGSGSNVSLNVHPNEVSSDGVVGKDVHHVHPFQMTTLDEEKKLKARIARSTRHMARQKSRNLKITSVNTSIASPPSISTRSRKINHAQSSAEGYEEHHPSIYTHDNVKLTFVLQKLLTPSDVSDQGRIVLPKAEENLPRLDAKEGTLFIMREVLSNTEWQLTYRFWANHKGRIYVLYNCGEFVSKNKLEAGDKLTLYQDVFKNNVSRRLSSSYNHIVNS
ncbi:putative transcription factor B3-Domain family [Helianthus annuus]|nr:putative transcription factor B3-Domain family [Helianthus annuus]